MALSWMRGDWVVHVEDGAHAIHAEVNYGLLTNKLKVTWDDEVVASSRLLLIKGNLKSFESLGHSFLLSALRGPLGTLSLSMDGVEVSTSVVAAPSATISTAMRGLVEKIVVHPPGAAPASTKPAPALTTVQFVKDISVEESEEIVGTEQYPLDNRFGDQALTATRQVSRESTNELSMDMSGQLTGKVGIDVLSAIKGEIEAQFSRQMGAKLGEKVAESQTLTFSVGPKSSVLYEVLWKRKVRNGKCLYVSDGAPVTIPYRMCYGLSCEVRTLAGRSGQ
jgi:hypothetical protein